MMTKIKLYLVISFWLSAANVFSAFAMTGVSLFSVTAILMAATFALFIMMLRTPRKPTIQNGDGVENEPVMLPEGAQIRGGSGFIQPRKRWDHGPRGEGAAHLFEGGFVGQYGHIACLHYVADTIGDGWSEGRLTL